MAGEQSRARSDPWATVAFTWAGFVAWHFQLSLDLGTQIADNLSIQVDAPSDATDIATALHAPDSVLDEQEQNFVQSIRRHGWFRTQIFAEAGYPEFSFTTGFWIGQGFPEVIVFSMPSNIAHDVLWHLYRMISSGSPPPIGELTSTIYANTDALRLPVDRQHYEDHLGWNRWFYGNDEFPCLQLLWPSKEGVFPRHPDASPALNLAQLICRFVYEVRANRDSNA